MHVENTSIYFIINGLASGDNDWIVSEINRVVCGHHSIIEMSRGGATPTEINSSTLHQFCDKKIADVRAATAGAAPPV